MKFCPHCTVKTEIRNTRHPFPGYKADPRHAALVARGEKVIGWYTTLDYLMRSRVCAKCGWKAETIEIILEDLVDMLDETEAGNRDPERPAQMPGIREIRNTVGFVSAVIFFAAIAQEAIDEHG